MKELEKIDFTAVDELAALKEKRQMLAGRLETLAKDKSVSKIVRQRIEGDYEQRRKEAREQMAPRLDKAAAEYAKLEKLAQRVEKDLAAIQLDREELEVRNRLGEFTDADYKKRMSEVDGRFAEQEKNGAAIDQVRRRFADALETPEDLAAIGAEAKALAALAAKEPAAKRPTAKEPAAKEPAAKKPPAAPPAKAPAAKTPAATKAPPDKSSTERVPGRYVKPAPDIKTRLLTPARLERLDTDDGDEPLILEPFTSIGRTSDNQVQIDELEVSRRHAEILREEDGFRLRDLGSQNGTFVNGDPVKECILSDGDRIQIGTARFRFLAS